MLIGALQSKVLWFFHQDGCEHCQMQDAQLQLFLAKHPEFTIVPCNMSRNPGWSIQGYRPKGTPAILLSVGGQPTADRLGVMTVRQLEEFVR